MGRRRGQRRVRALDGDGGQLLLLPLVDRLGRNLLEGRIVLNDLFQRDIAVKVLEGIAAGEHTERSLILDLALALSEDRRRDPRPPPAR